MKQQLKLSRLFSLLLVLALVFTASFAGMAEEGGTAPETETVPVTGVEVSDSAITLYVGESDKSFTVNVLPDNATNQGWSAVSSSSAVATVSGGTIHAVAPGSAIITITTNDGAKKATIAVTVKQKVGEITLTAGTYTLKVGGSTTVTAKISPDNATDKGITYTSSDSAVAAVAGSGNTATVTAKAAGSAVITATAQDGKGAASSVTIHVQSVATGITLTPAGLDLKENETAQLTAQITPSDASQKVQYTSQNPDVATVSESGLVTAVKAGTAVITATAADGSGVSATCTVKVGTTPIVVPVTGVTVNPSAAVLDVQETKQLTAAVVPSDATEQGVIFKSSNTNVAVVSDSGLVTAVAKGSAIITITSKENSSISATCNIKVGKPVEVTDVTVQPAAVSLKTGDTKQLSVSVLPTNADDRSVSYTSSNTAVAVVSASGLVTAKGPGTAEITVAANDGSGKSAVCTVTVTQPVKSVTVSPASVVVQKGGVSKLTASVVPANASNQELVYKTSNSAVASVSNDGIITGVGEGWATITVCAKENESIYGTCTVKVGTPVYVQEIKLDATSATMWAGATRQLSATVTPTNADIKTLSYGSSNPDVATVSAGGLITALKKGTTTITATATDGSGKSVSCEVTVKQPVTGIQISPNGFTLVQGEVKQLTAIVSPADADNTGVTWSSGNSAVAAVSSDGRVTAVSAGSCTITATCKDNASISASCTIVVGTPVSSITLAPSKASMKTGETILLIASVLPANATNQNIIWSSSDVTMATVSGGSVSALKPGTVTITAKAADNNGAQATCVITITGTPVPTATPTPAPTTAPTAAPVSGTWYRVNTEKGSLNVRKTAGGTIIDKIPENGTVLVTSYGSTWCQVYYNNNYGYVMTKFIKKIGDDPTVTPTIAPTAPAGQTAQVNTVSGALNIRDKIGGSVIGKIPEKAYFIVTEYGTTWCKAWYDGQSGYVMTKYLVLTGGSMPTATPVPTAEPIVDYARVTTESGGLNMRETVNGTRIAVIPQNTVIGVIIKGADWCRVSYNGKTGYVMTKFLTFGATPATPTPTPAPETITSYARVNTVSGGLNMRETPNGTRIAVIPQNTIIGVITKGAEWSRVVYNGKTGYVMTKFLADSSATPTPTVSPTASPSGSVQCYGKVSTANGGSLNMRSGPATTYARILSIKNGGVVDVYEQGTIWSRVKYNGTFGYVMSQYLIFSSTRPDEGTDPTPVDPTGAKAQVTTTAGSLNMRAGMGTTYAVITRIPQKAYVDVLTYGPTWCYVSYNGTKGYVMTTYLTMIN